MAAHQAPPSLGFSRQEHWSRLPFPSPMRESEVAQSCPTLSNPMDCSLPGSSIHGIFQARVLEWGAIAFSEPDKNDFHTRDGKGFIWISERSESFIFFWIPLLTRYFNRSSTSSQLSSMLPFSLPTTLLNTLLCIKRRRQWHPTPVLLPGKSHGWRSLVGCSPWGC